MAVIRFDPFRDPLERLLSMAATGTRAPLGMPMDVYRAGDGSYHVEADLPGVEPEQRRGDRGAQHLDDPGRTQPALRRERAGHRRRAAPGVVYTRQLSLGEGVDSENLTAAYADGVLHLTIPVSPKTQARRVEITHAPGGSRTIPGTAEPGEAPASSTGGG